GATAAKYLLNVQDSMANLRGKIYDVRGIPLVVTYHPAYLLRDPRQKKETWMDLQMVMRFLGMPLPKKSHNA
ncbi:MAG: uracil-DNA glycosylase family protein, partial [Acidobacteriaceae bacterium]